MPADAFDTIVVGARCAGASLAVPLARAGQKVRRRTAFASTSPVRSSAFGSRTGGLPLTAALVEGNARDGDLLGVLKLRYGFREAAGPGFALVGDSGLHKDPTPGYGITDALRDARNLAKAILSGTDDALLRYWRQRDVDSIDLFHFARDMGDPSYVNPLNRLVYEHAARSPDLMARLQAQANREISPYEVVQLGTLLKLMGGALLRGNFSVLPAFFAAGKRGATVEKERKERVGLLGAMGPAPA